MLASRNPDSPDLFARRPSGHETGFQNGESRSAAPAPWRPALPGGVQSAEAFSQSWKRALILLLVANFLGYATIGSNGIFRWNGYRIEKNERLELLGRLTAEQTRLARRVDLLNPAGADADLVEEMVRGELGFVRPDEVIMMIP